MVGLLSAPRSIFTAAYSTLGLAGLRPLIVFRVNLGVWRELGEEGGVEWLEPAVFSC